MAKARRPFGSQDKQECLRHWAVVVWRLCCLRLLDAVAYRRIDNLTMQHSTCIMALALAGTVTDRGERKALGAIL